jgi:hypothetical protein
MASGGHKVHASHFLEDAAVLYLDGGSPLYDPVVYLSFPDRRVYLSAAHDEGYASGREALWPVVQMPSTAQVSCSMLVIVAAAHILDTADALDELRERFDDELALADEVSIDDARTNDKNVGPLPTMEEAQRIIDRIVYNHNEAVEETDEQIAEVLDVAPELVAHVREALPHSHSSDDSGPRVDRLGLSPRAFHELTSRPVPASDGALVLRESAGLTALGARAVDLVTAAPIVRFAAWLLGTVGGGERIPATKAGYVKPSLVAEAGETGVITSPRAKAIEFIGRHPGTTEDAIERLTEHLRPKREGDSEEFLNNRELLETARLIRLEGNAFRVTDEGRRGLEDPVWMYHHLLVTMFRSHEWYEIAYFKSLPGLRERAGFLFYALHTMCGGKEAATRAKYEWVRMSRLVAAFVGTLPTLAETLRHPQEGDTAGFVVDMLLSQCFVSFFGRTFGLLESRATTVTDDEAQESGSARQHATAAGRADEVLWVRPTALLPLVFQIGRGHS